MSTRRSFVLATGAAAAAAALASCSIVRTSPVKATFLLEPAMPPQAAKPQPGVLRVGTINVAAPYRGRAFIVRETDLKYESDYYYEFLSPPGTIIGDATARALTSARVFNTVLPLGVPADSDWMLEGFVGAIHGDALWASNPTLCCSIRKVGPLGHALGGLEGWITGMRREQSPTRANAKKIGWDERHELWQANPLADWTEDAVDAYIAERELPVNVLHSRGYASIGCTHCTAPGTGREGRWTGSDKTECGLHADA